MPTNPPEGDVAGLRALLEKATPVDGWKTDRMGTCVEIPTRGPHCVSSAYAGTTANAALILKAVQSLPGLLDRIDRLTAEREALRDRGAEAVIAYHLAICCPKGVVPVEDLYDSAIAQTVEDTLAKSRTALDRAAPA